jgi:hypothetical protein
MGKGDLVMKVRKTTSNAATRCFAAMLGIGFGLCIPTNSALADDRIDLEQLTAQWWQWALSIPTAQNPFVDQNGGNCMIGQRGSVWFLAGGTATRTCSVPAGTTLFFPVINLVGFNSPNCSGQGPENLTVRDLRKATANFIDSVSLADLSVALDSHPIYHFERVQSDVFAIAVPADNITGPSGDPSQCAAGVYSPAVDDGYYVKLDPLKVGPHTVHIQVTAPFSIDVTYNLAVVQVSHK